VAGTAFNPSNWDGYDSASFTLAASQTDFTLLVDLSRMSASWNAAVQSDGGCIRVTKSDGTTELAYDLIDWAYNAGSPTGFLRVLFSGASGTGSNTIRIWTDYNAGTAVAYDASETYGSDNAYDANWMQYLPLDADANDRTSNGYNGTLQSLSFGVDDVAAQVGKGLDLDGANDYIVGLPTGTAIRSADNFTISMWANHDSESSADYNEFFSNWVSTGSKGSMFLRYQSSSNQLVFAIADGSYENCANTVAIEGALHHIAVVFDSGDATVYLDGSALTNTITGLESRAGYTGGQAFWWGASPHFSGENVPGIVDELQIALASRASGWITAEYDQTDDNATFWGTWTWTDDSGGAAGIGGRLVCGGLVGV
jgi:hypothetical protein